MNGSIALPADFSDAVKHAAKIVDKADNVRVISHYDADGLAAASVMAGALTRMGKQFHLSMVKGLEPEAVERIAKEGNPNILFLDMGSGQIDGLESLDAKVVALDHHKPIRKSKKVVQVNPHFHGMDGMTEACGASLSLLLSVVMDPANWDLSPVALAGVVGDRQHMGGMKGLNLQILEQAVERKHITVQRGLNLTGTTVVDTISNSVDPYFIGLSGREENVLAFLESVKINPKSPMGSLDEVYRRKLTSMLSLRLMGQGCRPETVEELVSDVHWIPSMELSTSDLADLLNACGRMDHEGLGVALSMGDKEALSVANGLRRQYTSKILERLLRIEEDGAEQMANIQYFEAPDPSLAGAQCGLAMQYILDQAKPTIAISRVNGKVKVSTRGTKHLVSKGLDLSSGLKRAAEKVGGVGGGHSVAAGATIPEAKLDEFLSILDETVGKQMG
ncbi:MAG: single-stranded-DNA-specific exonuclease [Candidatus Thermoplasmatota archaeon]|nr:single-stranded-DNA-specific exonuclease [Candidatus Thermoplasmatota archaeon]